MHTCLLTDTQSHTHSRQEPTRKTRPAHDDDNNNNKDKEGHRQHKTHKLRLRTQKARKHTHTHTADPTAIGRGAVLLDSRYTNSPAKPCTLRCQGPCCSLLHVGDHRPCVEPQPVHAIPDQSPISSSRADGGSTTRYPLRDQVRAT